MPSEHANNNLEQNLQEPRGFAEHSRGLSGEYAHEQGWGLNEEERKKQSDKPQDIDGGTDYEYGAQDFGDTPVNTLIDRAAEDLTQNTTMNKWQK